MIHRKKGFTLVELLVVMAIIAILAAIVVPNVTSYIKRARAVRALGDIKGIELALTKMMSDATVSSLHHFFDPNHVGDYIADGVMDDPPIDPTDPNSASIPRGLKRANNGFTWMTDAQFRRAQLLYTRTLYALLREGRAALNDRVIDAELGITFPEVLGSKVRQLGTTYLEDIGTDPWGASIYQIYPGPWPSSGGPVPFRIFMKIDETNLPGSRASAGKEDAFTIFDYLDPETEEAGLKRSFSAPRDKMAFIYSTGQNMVTGQVLYGFGVVPGNLFDVNQEATLWGGGDDVNNWDPNQTWMLFYN